MTGSEEMAPFGMERSAIAPILVFDVHSSVPCRPDNAGNPIPAQ